MSWIPACNYPLYGTFGHCRGGKASCAPSGIFEIGHIKGLVPKVFC